MKRRNRAAEHLGCSFSRLTGADYIFIRSELFLLAVVDRAIYRQYNSNHHSFHFPFLTIEDINFIMSYKERES